MTHMAEEALRRCNDAKLRSLAAIVAGSNPGRSRDASRSTQRDLDRSRPTTGPTAGDCFSSSILRDLSPRSRDTNFTAHHHTINQHYISHFVARCNKYVIKQKRQGLLNAIDILITMSTFAS